MFDLILASTKNGGIGLNGKLPWNIPQELKYFKEKTQNSILVIGRKTAESLPHLSNRHIVCITHKDNLDTSKHKNIPIFTGNLENAIAFLKKENKPIFIAGGARLYQIILNNYRTLINNIYISIIKKEYACDTFVNIDYHSYHRTIEEETPEFTKFLLIPKNDEEHNYLNLLRRVLYSGYTKIGRNGETKSIFAETLKFNLQKGFPLLSTKKMFFRGIVEELLFFIRGQTDSKILENKKVNIWKGNTNRQFLDYIGMTQRKEGIMGEMYGYQWRYFNAPYDEEKAAPKQPGIDQLQNVINLLKTDPNSRRILMTSYNPAQVNGGVLYPCHSIVLQFYVQDGYLDCFCYNRSSDLFHGLPFNIASTSLLIILIARETNLKPRHFTLSLGDCHIYKEHYQAVEKQLQRDPYAFTKVYIRSVENIENLKYQDFSLFHYRSHPSIKVNMVA